MNHTLTGDVIVVVIGAGAVHATWNAIAKYIKDGLMAFALIGAVSMVAGGVALLLTGLPASRAIAFVLASVVIHVAYETFLMNSYRLGSYNQTYPIARGTSPLLVAVGAFFLADEHLAPATIVGIAVLGAGLMWLAVSGGSLSRADMPAVLAALATGVTIAAYTIVDGLGVRRAGDPYAYAALLFFIQGPVFPVVALFKRPLAAWRQVRDVSHGVLAGALSIVAYSAVLWAQTRAPLAEVAALRETSVIFAAVIGSIALKEGFGQRRLAAAVLVAIGIILIST